MKLIDNLYTITKFDSEARAFELHLNPECLIYKAHFPGMPITPGVCIIGIASELLEVLLEQQIQLDEVINAKFIATINPLEKPDVTFTFNKLIIDNDQQTVKINVVATAQTIVCSKLSLLYRLK